MILDLIANADWQAGIEQKYEDAVARLYNCLERGARFRLLARSPSVDNENVAPEQVPAVVREELVRRHRGEQVAIPPLGDRQVLVGEDLMRTVGLRLPLHAAEDLPVSSLSEKT